MKFWWNFDEILMNIDKILMKTKFSWNFNEILSKSIWRRKVNEILKTPIFCYTQLSTQQFWAWHSSARVCLLTKFTKKNFYVESLWGPDTWGNCTGSGPFGQVLKYYA